MASIFKKQDEAEAATAEEKPLFRTVMSGFNKNDVNLYINSLNKKIGTLEEQLKKANEKLMQNEQHSNAAYEAKILELQEELRREKMKSNPEPQKIGMPEAVTAPAEPIDNLSDEFKDILV